MKKQVHALKTANLRTIFGVVFFLFILQLSSSFLPLDLTSHLSSHSRKVLSGISEGPTPKDATYYSQNDILTDILNTQTESRGEVIAN